MLKQIAILVTLLILSSVHGQRQYQNLQTDFINSEANRAPQKPANQPQNNVRDFVNTRFNQPTPTGTTSKPNQLPGGVAPISTGVNQPSNPTQTPNKPNQPIQPPNNPNQSRPTVLPVPVPANRPNQPVPPVQSPNNPTQSRPTVLPVPVPANKPREEFPGLPKAGTVTPTSPTNKISYSSVVSGNNKPGSTNSNPSNGPRPATPQPPTWFSSTTASTPAAELISDAELKTISESLFKKDTSPSKYVTINYQGRTTSSSKNDEAPQPLISINQDVWKVGTVAAMKTLLDNYEQDSLVNEHITPQERTEENDFMELIMNTPVMRQLMLTLKDKGLVSPDPKVQKDFVKSIWFNMYSRGQGKIGSSGFEHIFLSEIKNNEISGLHNWLYFYLEEEAKRANYLGYMKHIEFGNKGGIIKYHFNLKGIDKPVGSMFVGTSPELEMALYSLCFITRVDKSCPLSMDGKTFQIRTHNYRYRSKNMIGSAFPEI